MLESKVQLAPPTKNVIMAALTPKSLIQLPASIAFQTGRKLNSACCNYVHFSPPAINFCCSKFFLSFFYFLFLVPLQTYIWQKKNWLLLTDLLKVKNNMLLPDNYHTQKRTYSLNTHP